MELVPASAGVIPIYFQSNHRYKPCPRIRGGDPLPHEVAKVTELLSPHPRG